MSSINYFDNLYKSCIKKINDYDFNNDVNLHNFINFINEDDYSFHFDSVLKNYLPTFFKFFSEFGFSFIYSKNINNYILTHVPESSINVFVDSLDIFYTKYYYNSFISIPVFESIIHNICTDYFFVNNTAIDLNLVNIAEENFKSLPNILNIVEKENLFYIDPLFSLLFANNKLDLRNLYSHCFFIDDTHIKSLSYLYNLLLVNLIINPKVKIFYEK